MERITLYHCGAPVVKQVLHKDRYIVGSDSSNDLVISENGVQEQHLMIHREKDGKWSAVPLHKEHGKVRYLQQGKKVSMGSFAVVLDNIEKKEIKDDNLITLYQNGEDKFKAMGWIGTSASMKQLKCEIQIVAPLSAPVLITGESGTGKELAARALHTFSSRENSPFIAINCGGISLSLLEDVLFGHERGAFTGASKNRSGIFRQSDKGTLFLDEIGDLPLLGQAALLRVLEDKTVRPLGSDTDQSVDFRLVTATNRNLQEMVKKSQFRLDLYHRISMLRLRTVPLRDHFDDLSMLSEYFLNINKPELGEKRLDPSAFEKMAAYRWPGNIRELRNVLYRAAAFSQNNIILPTDLDIPVSDSKKIRMKLSKLSMKHINRVLKCCNGNVSAAAQALGVPRSSLRDRIQNAKHEPNVSDCDVEKAV